MGCLPHQGCPPTLLACACAGCAPHQDHQVARFTSESKEQFGGVSGVTITTFTMVAFSGKRSDESEKVGSAAERGAQSNQRLLPCHDHPFSMVACRS